MCIHMIYCIRSNLAICYVHILDLGGFCIYGNYCTSVDAIFMYRVYTLWSVHPGQGQYRGCVIMWLVVWYKGLYPKSFMYSEVTIIRLPSDLKDKSDIRNLLYHHWSFYAQKDLFLHIFCLILSSTTIAWIWILHGMVTMFEWRYRNLSSLFCFICKHYYRLILVYQVCVQINSDVCTCL